MAVYVWLFSPSCSEPLLSPSQVSRWRELVVQRRALRGVRVRAAGGRHCHRLRGRIPAGGLRGDLLPRQDVAGSVRQGRVRRSRAVREAMNEMKSVPRHIFNMRDVL